MTPGPALRTVARALGAEGRRRVALLAVLTVLGGLAEFATLMALMDMLGTWLSPVGRYSLGTSEALAFAAAVAMAGIVRLLILVVTQRLAFDTGHRLVVAAQRRVLARSWTDHAAARGTGPLMAIEQVENVLYGVLLPLLNAGMAIVLGAAIMSALIRIDALIAFLAAGLLLGLFAGITLLLRPGLKRAGQAFSGGIEERMAAIQEQAGAMRELILAGRRGLAVERVRAADRRVADARVSISVALAAPRLLVETLGLLGATALAWWLAAHGGGLGLALPALASLALGMQRLLPLAQTLNQAVAGLIANGRTLDDLAQLLDEPEWIEQEAAEPLAFRSEVRLENVRFTYPRAEQPALDGVDLILRKSERVALVGRNGAGKSSLADVVMGLLAPEAGQLLLDGVPLRAEDIPGWQRCIAHVPQAPFLADRSIAANIAFMDEEPDLERVTEAARVAGLHDFVSGLAGGYESRAGERGALLSGGQRQRLALARALYAPAPLLVLDEATSALDPESERHVLAALDVLQSRGTTILLIAHRATMLDGCDRVVRMEAGRIVG